MLPIYTPWQLEVRRKIRELDEKLAQSGVRPGGAAGRRLRRMRKRLWKRIKARLKR